MTWVKLCGLTSLGEVAMCASAGADALGFVVEYPAEVPWNLTLGEARELVAAVPAGVERVMVAGDDAGLVLAHAEALRPDAVQLHADEAPATTQELARELKAIRAVAPHGVDVISGVEARRRVKDPAKVAAFIEAARGIA